MNKDDIAESLRDLLNKTTWIDQPHMLLYCCNDGHFITDETSEDLTIEDENEADDQLSVDTSFNSSEAADEFAKIVADQQAKDSKTSNIIKVTDSKNVIIEIDLNQEDRSVLINKIKAKDPEFDPKKLLYLTINNKSTKGYYRKKLAGQP